MFRRLAAVTLVALTAACASPGPAGPGSRAPEANTRTSLERRAGQDLEAYDRAVAAAGQGPLLAPVGPLTQTVGRWVPFDGDRKSAFVANLFTADVQLGTARSRNRRGSVGGPPLDRPAHLRGGSRRRMRGAAEGSCTGWAPLHLTHPRLGTMTIGTGRGPARSPCGSSPSPARRSGWLTRPSSQPVPSWSSCMNTEPQATVPALPWAPREPPPSGWPRPWLTAPFWQSPRHPRRHEDGIARRLTLPRDGTRAAPPPSKRPVAAAPVSPGRRGLDYSREPPCCAEQPGLTLAVTVAGLTGCGTTGSSSEVACAAPETTLSSPQSRPGRS